MKIEVGESLVLSWLKHVQKCQIVQTNWKPSPEWKEHNSELVQQIEKYASEYFLKLGYNLFKKSSADQVQRQAEIDVLGIAFTGDEKKIYAVDIAFHKGGLGYSDNTTTVLKKCIRSMMCLIKYFDVTTGHIVFASPKINPKDYQKLHEEFAKIDDIVKHFSFDFTFELISNERFSTEIMQPVLAVSEKVSDTSELFLRSAQLIDICGMQGRRGQVREGEKLDTASCVRSPSTQKLNKATDRDINIVAFCFSYFEHTPLYPNNNQTEAFRFAAQSLGMNKNSLKNIRDAFDGHNDNARRGWWQAELSPLQQEIKKQYEDRTKKEEVITMAKEILGI